MVFKRTFLIIQEGFKQNPTALLNMTKDLLPTIMTKISATFCILREKHKPEILQLLTDAIAYLPEAYVKQHIKERHTEARKWTRNLKLGLIQLLSTRQGNFFMSLPAWQFFFFFFFFFPFHETEPHTQ